MSPSRNESCSQFSALRSDSSSQSLRPSPVSVPSKSRPGTVAESSVAQPQSLFGARDRRSNRIRRHGCSSSAPGNEVNKRHESKLSASSSLPEITSTEALLNKQSTEARSSTKLIDEAIPQPSATQVSVPSIFTPGPTKRMAPADSKTTLALPASIASCKLGNHAQVQDASLSPLQLASIGAEKSIKCTGWPSAAVPPIAPVTKDRKSRFFPTYSLREQGRKKITIDFTAQSPLISLYDGKVSETTQADNDCASNSPLSVQHVTQSATEATMPFVADNTQAALLRQIEEVERIEALEAPPPLAKQMDEVDKVKSEWYGLSGPIGVTADSNIAKVNSKKAGGRKKKEKKQHDHVWHNDSEAREEDDGGWEWV